jgi:hypothetical protein
MAALTMTGRLVAGLLAAGIAVAGIAGCASSGSTPGSGPAAASPVPGAASSAVVPDYTATITIVAVKGARPRCSGPATIRLGTWYTVRQHGNAPVSFEIPGVAGAARPVRRTATYTDSEFRAARAGTYRLVIRPAPATPCRFTIRRAGGAGSRGS